MYNLLFLKKAEIEYEQSFIWYENQQQGLGKNFETAVEATLEKIKRFPKANKIVRQPFREAGVKKFPFVIIYQINEEKNLIQIAAVFHTKRSPNVKYKKAE